MRKTANAVRTVKLEDLVKVKKTITSEKNFNWWLNTVYAPIHQEHYLWMVQEVWGGIPDAEQCLAFIIQQGCNDYYDENALERQRKNEERKARGDNRRQYSMCGTDFHRMVSWNYIEKLRDLKVLEYVEHPKKYLFQDLKVVEAEGMPLFGVSEIDEHCIQEIKQ